VFNGVPAARIAGIAATLIAVPAAVGLILDEPDPATAALEALAVLAFYVSFFYAVRGRGMGRPAAVVARSWLVCMAIAVTLTVADQPDWNLLFFYVVALGGLRFPRPWNFLSVFATATIAVVASELGGAASGASAGNGLGLLGIGAAMIAMGELMRANRDLREARAEVARLAVADERERFARDLHDLLGHSLSVIAIKSQLARRRLPGDPEAAVVEVADIERVTRNALREVREAVSGYRQPELDAELAGARTALDAAGIATTIERPEVDLPSDVDAVLAWTVREAATNVIRHSGARHSAIRVVPAVGEATVEVVDDGDGDGDGTANGGGSGLIGLQERVRAAGGRLEAGPREDGPGFRLRATVPIASPR
jgi:two-component system, NarL family, sensor histidine kinase DesK